MNRSTFSSQFDADPEAVFEWHARPGALHRLLPPWHHIDVVEHEGVRKNSVARLRMHVGPVSLLWKARHTEVVPGSHFVDELVRGPFRRWKHAHRVSAENGGCRLTDELEYALPFGAITHPLFGRAVEGQLERQFAYRHRITRSDLRLHDTYGGRRLRIALSGSHKLIGSQLIHFLEAGGHDVLRIVHHAPEEPEREIHWNHHEDILEREKLEGLDAVIHLGGEHVLSLARWSEQKKMEIVGNRVGGTEHLARSLAALDDPPKVFLSASAMGFYGDRGEEELDETSEPGDDGFLSAICQDWETATFPAAEAGVRTVQMRIGVVLTSAGGVLRSLLIPFRLGLGGRYGGRDQFLSWIGMDDALAAVYHLLVDEDINGPVNLTSPTPVPMSEFAETLGRVLSRPVYLNMPPGVVRFLLGKISDDAALMSVRALPSSLISAGHTFLYPELEDLLRHVLGRTSEPLGERVVDETGPSTVEASSL